MKSRFWLVLSLALSGVTWVYAHRILIPGQHYYNVEVGTMKADLGDLYTPWFATRALLLQRRNPYSPEVTHEIQMDFYGRTITQESEVSRGFIVDEQRFAYPVYVVFPLAPIAYWSFEEVHPWVAVVLALLTVAGVCLWFATLRWFPPWPYIAAVALAILCSPPIVQGLRLCQLGLFVGFLLALAAWCVARNHLVTAGVVLAWSTIKPQMVLIPLLWFLLWSMGDWRNRLRLPTGFFLMLAALMGASQLLLRGWLRYFVEGLRAYSDYTFRPSLLELATGKLIGEILGGAFVIALLALAWKNRKEAGDSPQFFITLAIFLMASMLIMPLLPLFNQLLLIFPAMILLREWRHIRKPARYIFIWLAAWPWVASAALLLTYPPGSYPSRRMLLLPTLFSLLLPFILPVLLIPRVAWKGMFFSRPQGQSI